MRPCDHRGNRCQATCTCTCAKCDFARQLSAEQEDNPMNTTLQAGQIVQHPEKGYGICVRGFGSQIDIWHGKTCLGYGATSCVHEPGDGWQPVEVVKPGHVQVRVDDLDLRFWEGSIEDRQSGVSAKVAARVARATQAKNRPDEPQEAGVKLMLGSARFISTDCKPGEKRIYVDVRNGYAFEWADILRLARRRNLRLSLGWDDAQ